MGAREILTLALTHPHEFRVLLQFWNYHAPKRDITRKEEHATSGWDRPSMRRCWELLDFTSRSFAAVIKELDGDLARVVSCSFVLNNIPRRPRYELKKNYRRINRSRRGYPNPGLFLTCTPRYVSSMSSSAGSIPSKMT